MKYKKTKEKTVRNDGPIEIVNRYYTEDQKGDIKVNFNPPIVIKLDDKKKS